MNPNIIPNPQQSPGEGQHQVIKTKALGNTGPEIPDEKLKQKLEEQKQNVQQERRNQNEQQAEKIKAEILEREGRMRHLKFDVFDDAGIVQVSVINTEDGTIIRKVPSDEMIELVKTLRESMKGSSIGLDFKA